MIAEAATAVHLIWFQSHTYYTRRRRRRRVILFTFFSFRFVWLAVVQLSDYNLPISHLNERMFGAD